MLTSPQPGTLHPPQTPIDEHPEFEGNSGKLPTMDSPKALKDLSHNVTVQRATGLDQKGLLLRLAREWTPERALQDCEYNANSVSR